MTEVFPGEEGGAGNSDILMVWIEIGFFEKTRFLLAEKLITNFVQGLLSLFTK